MNIENKKRKRNCYSENIKCAKTETLYDMIIEKIKKNKSYLILYETKLNKGKMKMETKYHSDKLEYEKSISENNLEIKKFQGFNQNGSENKEIIDSIIKQLNECQKNYHDHFIKNKKKYEEFINDYDEIMNIYFNKD